MRFAVGSGCHVRERVRKAWLELGWDETADARDAGIVWSPPQALVRRPPAGLRVGAFGNSSEVFNKWTLVLVLRRALGAALGGIMPRTLLSCDDLEAAGDDALDGWVVVKPAFLSHGDGVVVAPSFAEGRAALQERVAAQRYATRKAIEDAAAGTAFRKPPRFVVQEFVHCSDVDGACRWDVRMFALALDGGRLLLRDGFLRKCRSGRDKQPMSAKATVTNLPIQLEGDIKPVDEVVLVETVDEWVRRVGVQDEFSRARSAMLRKTKVCIDLAWPQIVRAPGSFELLGLDFVIDAHWEPWLLEINTLPSLRTYGFSTLGHHYDELIGAVGRAVVNGEEREVGWFSV